MIDNLAIGLTLALIGIGVLGIVFSGLRNVINGKSEFKKVSIMLIPVAVFGISFATMGSVAQAGVATMIFMVGAMALGILITGTRGTFKI
ncbi:MAG: hypothetical protein R3283_03225 [Balneolaceae bacterium]|nr:hypothetical protein [Balneolaceae bacterium]